MPAALDQLGNGDSGRVIGVSGDPALTQRLLALGILPGGTVRVVAVAPMGDPLTIETSNGRVSLRRKEAAAVTVESNG